MPTPAEIIDMAASCMNDTAQTVYTDAAVLPYLNMALRELQEIFEQNNIPVTSDVSSVLTVPTTIHAIPYAPTVPAPSTPYLPSDLIEIQRIWESETGVNVWSPMTKKEYLPAYMEGVNINRFLYWTWQEQEIRLPTVLNVLDLKIDYVKSLFDTIDIGDIATDIPFRNVFSFLGYRTGALCAQFIGENTERAQMLEGMATASLDRSLGISIKGKQVIVTRHRPFRASYRNRGVW